MVNQVEDFDARMKRVRARARVGPPQLEQRRTGEDFDERAFIVAVLRPQFALILGALALIVGRAIAMNYLGVEADTSVLSLGEGVVAAGFLVLIGILFGRSDYFSHAGLLLGAAAAFLTEVYWVPLVPDLMRSVYTPVYVDLVLLKAF